MHLLRRSFPLLLALLLTVPAHARQSGSFDIGFRVDTGSADELVALLSGRAAGSGRLASLRGTRLAAATSLLLARTSGSDEDFQRAVDRYRNGGSDPEDRYGLGDTRAALPELRSLLDEIRRRQLDRRVRSTLASYFPAEPRLRAEIPVYVVAFGNEKAAAFVRHVVWEGDIPRFTGENDGEPVIVLNLVRCLDAPTVDARFTEMLAVLAHECFHAVYAVYRRTAGIPPSGRSPVEALADLVQNEGIAYLLSLQIRIGGEQPGPAWFNMTSRGVGQLQQVLTELASPGLTRERAQQLIMDSNLSGSFEGNYGVAAGVRIAYEIEQQLGRAALVETIAEGTPGFYRKYQQVARRAALPPFSTALLNILGVHEPER